MILILNGQRTDVSADPDHTALGPARKAQAHRHQVRLRHGDVRRVYRGGQVIVGE